MLYCVEGGGRVRIAVSITCFNDALFPATGKGVVRLLERLGHEITFSAAQTCLRSGVRTVHLAEILAGADGGMR